MEVHTDSAGHHGKAWVPLVFGGSRRSVITSDHVPIAKWTGRRALLRKNRKIQEELTS